MRLGFKAHPHMLRHACGYALANKGHDTRALQAYLGHEYPAHGALHGIVANTVSGFLASVICALKFGASRKPARDEST